MERTNRNRMAFGVILILLGLWFLAEQIIPGFSFFSSRFFSWPFIIILVGAAFLVIGLLTRAPGMAIPACVIGGIGGLLYYQNVTGDWGSWAYAWALIPGFVGVGTILAGLLGDPEHRNIAEGARMVLVSLVIFLIFGSFMGGFPFLGPYWPVLIIALGALLLVQAIIKK